MNKIVAACLLSISANIAFAQASLESAQTFFNSGDIPNAKKLIDELANSPKEEKNAAMWFTKAAIYQKVIDDKTLFAATPNATNQTLEAYKKFTSTAKKEEISLAKNNYISFMQSVYNKAVINYQSQKYNDAENLFEFVNTIADADKGTLLQGEKLADTITAKAKLSKAYCLINNKKPEEAKTLLEASLKNPIVKEADIYLRLSNIYAELGPSFRDEQFRVIKDGIASYPKNIDLKNEEINYLSSTGKNADLAKRLEEMVKDDPKNHTLMFSLANVYEDLLIESKDAAEVKTMRGKLVSIYDKVIALDNKKADYTYSLGALYYNQAVEINAEMNKMIADGKKPEALKLERDELLKKAKPSLEKAITLYEAGGLKENDKNNHENANNAIKKIKEALEKKG
jgi:hypothetical protein